MKHHPYICKECGQKKGQRLIEAFMLMHRIGEKDFFESKFPEHLALRVEAIRLLHDAGLSRSEIGYAVRRDDSTIGYWLNGDIRKRKAEHHAKTRGRKRTSRNSINERKWQMASDRGSITT